MKPVRIQRKRVKGFKLPENTVSVTRPHKWGNPFIVIKDVEVWVVYDSRINLGLTWWDNSKDAADDCIKYYREYILEQLGLGKLSLSELRGKNLACFCPIGSPCHADVLLELANK